MSKKVFEVALLLTAADKASRIINDVTANARKKIEGMSNLGDKAFGVGRGAAATGIVLGGILAAPLKAAADMESMNISLRTSFQGNAKAAEIAFNDINKFAAATPYGLEEVMTSFIKLKNMGLDPGQEALTGYGNTASAMGKSLNDMVEAVADAATGEFERLKEFGIKASSEGDRVTFLFQGVKTTVGKNSKEIEQYLKYIGNVKFAGGIVAQSKSVNGMLSTLKDGVVMTAAKIGTTLIPRLKNLMNDVTPVIDKIAAWVEKNPKLTETILKVVAGAALLSFTISASAFAFGGLAKGIAAVMWISQTYQKLVLIMRAGQMAFTFAVLAGQGATGGMTAALTAMNLAFLANPITWVIIGIVALVAAGYLLIKNWDKVKSFFVGLWVTVKQVFWKAIDFMKEWGILFLGPIGWVIKAWQLVPNKFKNIGADIIAGLWNGIKSKAMALFDFVKGIGKGIATAFKTVLGIASPSKVFMDYGVNITEGAHNGIKKGQSKLIGASAGMGNSIKPNAGSKGGGGSSVTINFAPVINGGSGDVAAQVKALIPELIRQIESQMQRKARLAY
jgi:hypothetical protein